MHRREGRYQIKGTNCYVVLLFDRPNRYYLIEKVFEEPGRIYFNLG